MISLLTKFFIYIFSFIFYLVKIPRRVIDVEMKKWRRLSKAKILCYCWCYYSMVFLLSVVFGLLWFWEVKWIIDYKSNGISLRKELMRKRAWWGFADVIHNGFWVGYDTGKRKKRNETTWTFFFLNFLCRRWKRPRLRVKSEKGNLLCM